MSKFLLRHVGGNAHREEKTLSIALQSRRARVTALFATLLALAFLSLAQSAPSAYGQARANQMIIALDPDWATFDPAHSYESTGQMVLKGVYEGLVRIHPVTRDFEPLLAREWTVSD